MKALTLVILLYTGYLAKPALPAPKAQKAQGSSQKKEKSSGGNVGANRCLPHTWIIGGQPFSLHGAIDDATGKILALFFAKNECLEGHFNIMEQIITQYGLPVSIYCDRHTIFISPKNGKLSLEEQLQGNK